MDIDLFGDPVEKNALLRERFSEPPFSVLNTQTGSWQNRKRKWQTLGIKSELGRDVSTFSTKAQKEAGADYMPDMNSDTSIFDPALTELMYNWFAPTGGTILDPFAGGSVRGIVANYLGFKYTGIELRAEQVESNVTQAKIILPDNPPRWITGDSNQVLDTIIEQFDFVLSCPPYFDLEVYSDSPYDLSNMTLSAFNKAYGEIIAKTVNRMKKGSFACFVVGEVRDKHGYYIDFVGETKRAFIAAGAKLYNDAILLEPIGSAMIRCSKVFLSGKKLTKVHQNVLIFKKP